MKEAIDSPARDESRDTLFFLAASGAEQDELRELILQLLEQRMIASQDFQVGNENPATAADQQVDSHVGARCVPD